MKELQLLKYKYRLVLKHSYATAWVIPHKKALICELKGSYVPDEAFRDILLNVGVIVEQEDSNIFILDRRQSRVFHQDSMEWYIVEWKKAMYDRGLVHYHEILPKDEEWFRDALEAGCLQIREKYPQANDLLNIHYCSSVMEAFV
ncbi:MAG: hypothetical protein AAF740_04015 [Bacteroidota bacterium]